MSSADMTYSDYLGLDQLLSATQPRSDAHDEMLFITIHQASELWMKLTLHELNAARAAIIADDLNPAFKMMARVSRIQHQLIQSWEVLSTMTPSDYSVVRPHLGTSSGFQSAQYRLIEYLLGNKNPKMTAVHEGRGTDYELLRAAERQPSLYDEALRLLSRRGLDIPGTHLQRDFTQGYQASAEIEAAWLAIYREPDRYWDLYELAEKLVDLQYHFQLWRFGHLKTVERVIGFKPGTGGTPGVPYLAEVVAKTFFPELLTVRTAL
jgi:tryptophan 2,3-dioxygenase|tara:strand:- start:148887 stop:149681 length:795 start_codon:yes stop_codon:yes gene_type:complete